MGKVLKNRGGKKKFKEIKLRVEEMIRDSSQKLRKREGVVEGLKEIEKEDKFSLKEVDWRGENSN